MEEKKGFSKKLNAFFAGKGFYIVLLLCAVLVGASFWLVGRGSGADVERDPVKETNITASAQETAPPQGSIPVMNTEEDERLPLGTGVLPAAEGEEVPEAQAPAVQEELPDVPVSVNESAPQFIRPVNGVLLRGFSAEALSYDRTMADWRVHRGWDIACAAGEPVLAVSGGTVTAVYEDDLLGTVVEIDHGNDVVSVYANLDVSPAVGVGQMVACGDTVGAVGTTALAESGEEAHLHFAMRRGGSTVDPAEYVPETRGGPFFGRLRLSIRRSRLLFSAD